MRLRYLQLDQFRSFRTLEFPVDPGGFQLIGPNASGKSSILEAVAMLATTRSPRTSSEREIPNWESGQEFGLPAYVHLRGDFERADGTHRIEIGLETEEGGQRPLKKRVRFDDRPVRAIDAVGQLKTVFFSPEDVALVSGSPSGRRRYLDMAISQASRVYLRALSRYMRVLEQRNGLLRLFGRDRGTTSARRPQQELEFWDTELTAAAVEVLAFRLGALEALQARARPHFARLTGDESLALTYLANQWIAQLPGATTENWAEPTLAQRQELASAFGRVLRAAIGEEMRRGVTAVGPHRDDFVVRAGGVDLGRYGSRGQQRLAVLALKLAELDLLHEAAGEAPVLLLDDALSELDVRHRAKLQEMLAAHDAQLLLTSTEELDGATSRSWKLPVLRAGCGQIVPYQPR
jgi:DNA replication and repair protein RecF